MWLTLKAPTGVASDEIPLGLVRLQYVHDGQPKEIELPDTLRVACVENERDFYADIDGDVWENSVMIDDYNSLRQRVARLVSEGKRGSAMQMIRGYQKSKAQMNAHVQSPAVAVQLESLEELSSEVGAAFAAGPAEQGALGKKLSADAIDGRRVGAKK